MIARLAILCTILITLAAGGPLLGQTPELAAPPADEIEAAPAGEGPETAAPPAEEALAVTERSADTQVLRALSALLRDHPRELSLILRLDPSLLANTEFVGKYPELAAFIARNPEVAQNPRLYIRRSDVPHVRSSADIAGDAIESVSIFATIAIFLFAGLWLIRTIIEQRRWNRLARVQNEVHGKLLERFTQSQDLLAYIESPAGRRFLESAPIQVAAAEAPAMTPPLGRLIWPLQIGVIVAIASIGIVLVSFAFSESRAELFAMGVIGLCLGVGFAASAVVSFLVSKRLGLWQPPAGTLGSE